MPRKVVTTVDLFNEKSRVVYGENEAPPENTNYKEWALNAES